MSSSLPGEDIRLDPEVPGGRGKLGQDHEGFPFTQSVVGGHVALPCGERMVQALVDEFVVPVGQEGQHVRGGRVVAVAVPYRL